jgi:hypothetical protein
MSTHYPYRVDWAEISRFNPLKMVIKWKIGCLIALWVTIKERKIQYNYLSVIGCDRAFIRVLSLYG